jgi:hypothetical protein
MSQIVCGSKSNQAPVGLSIALCCQHSE